MTIFFTHTFTDTLTHSQLYPQYTYGSTGTYSTDEGQISACDFDVVKGAESKPSRPPIVQNHIDKGQEVPLINGDISPTSVSTQTPTLVTSDDKENSSPVGYMPPTGLVPFVDDTCTSQDNSQSCDQPVQRASDDVLIAGSLQEIENQGSVGWSLPPSNKSKDSLSNGDMGALSFTPGLIENDSKKPNNWYEEDLRDFSLAQEHPSKEDERSTFHSSSSQPLESLGRTRSNSILRRHSARLKDKTLAGKGSNMSGSMSALDSISDDSRHISRSVDLGRFKIKKRGDKSLEALTRIQDGHSSSSTNNQQHSASSMKRYKSDEHAHRVNLLNRSDGLSEPDDRESPWMHQSLDSTTSPQRGLLKIQF